MSLFFECELWLFKVTFHAVTFFREGDLLWMGSIPLDWDSIREPDAQIVRLPPGYGGQQGCLRAPAELS